MYEAKSGWCFETRNGWGRLKSTMPYGEVDKANWLFTFYALSPKWKSDLAFMFYFPSPSVKCIFPFTLYYLSFTTLKCKVKWKKKWHRMNSFNQLLVNNVILSESISHLSGKKISQCFIGQGTLCNYKGSKRHSVFIILAKNMPLWTKSHL